MKYSRNMKTIIFTILLLIGLASSDMKKDMNECANQLVGLSPCVAYVGGTDAEAPTSDCCSGLKLVLAKGMKCLCVLIKDRDDPDLGIKINGTLGLALPDVCHIPSYNASSCLELLNLAPHSPEALIFEEYANANANKTKRVVASPVPSKVRNNGGLNVSIKWLGVEMICGVLLWCFI